MPAPASDLALRPTVIAGDKLENDYLVIWDGIRIGRIMLASGVPNDRPQWSWGVGFPHKPQMPYHRGQASDLEECKRRFRVAWSDVHAKLTDEDVTKAREQDEDNRKRWKT